MEQILLSPPASFGIYLVLAALLYGLGRLWAAKTRASDLKTTTYASGEAPPPHMAAPGYRAFFVVALFFVVLHLGALVLGTSPLNWLTGVYVAGLVLILVMLILK